MILQFSINHLYDTIERTKQRGNNCKKNSFFLFNLHPLLCSLPYQVVLADDLDLPAQSAIAVEADTGKILYERIQRKSEMWGTIYTLDHLSDFQKPFMKKTFWKDPIKLSEESSGLKWYPKVLVLFLWRRTNIRLISYWLLFSWKF